MTVQQLKGVIQRSFKVQNVKQKLSYLDHKVRFLFYFNNIAFSFNLLIITYTNVFLTFSFRIAERLNLLITWNNCPIIPWHLVIAYMSDGNNAWQKYFIWSYLQLILYIISFDIIVERADPINNCLFFSFSSELFYFESCFLFRFLVVLIAVF